MRAFPTFLLNLLFVAVTGSAWAQNQLLDLSFQPQVGDLIQNMSLATPVDPLEAPSADLFENVDRFISIAEAAYPGLTYAFLGRDVTPLALAVQAHYTARGEAARVVLLPLSGPSVRGMNESQIVEFLMQYGMGPVYGPQKRPFILIDRSAFSHGEYDQASQMAILLNAVYRSLDRQGIPPSVYVPRYSAISVYSSYSMALVNSTHLEMVYSPYQAKDLSLSVHRVMEKEKTIFMAPHKIMAVQVDPRLIDRADLEWTDSFGKVRREEKASALQVAPPKSDLQKRFRALDYLQHVWRKARVKNAGTPFGNFMQKYLPNEYQSSIQTTEILNWMRDPNSGDAEKFAVQSWFFDLARSSQFPTAFLKFFSAAFPAKWTIADQKDILEKIFDSKWSTQTRWNFVTLELAVLAQLAREARGNSDLQEKISNRFAQTLDVWLSFEGANGRKISQPRLALLQDLMGRSAEENAEFAEIFNHSLENRLAEDSEKMKTVAALSTHFNGFQYSDPEERFSMRLLGGITALFSAGSVGTYMAAGDPGLAFVIGGLGVYVGQAGFKNLKANGFFQNALVARKVKRLFKPDKTKQGAAYLETLDQNRQTVHRACSLSLRKN